jgi:hypothetical protein
MYADLSFSMSSSETAEALHFDDKNAIHFLRRFERLCKNHGIFLDAKKLNRLSDYCIR